MDSSGSFNTPGGIVQIPGNNIADLGSGGQTHGSADSSELSLNDPARRVERYDTPPASFVEAVSPTSSRKRGQLRAESLGISRTKTHFKSLKWRKCDALVLARLANRGGQAASAGRVNRAISSKGVTGPRKLLPQISTSAPILTYEAPMSQMVGQPLLRAPVPSIEETLRRLNDNVSGTNTRISDEQSNALMAPANLQLRPHPYGEEELARRGHSVVVESKDPRDDNPYVHRADEIGHSHRIPGLTHLGGLLIPPGWKDGDEPIDPQAAQTLYDTARHEARNALTKSMEETKNLSANAQERRNQERHNRWDTQLKLDDVLLKERIKIYEMYQERKRMRVQRANLWQLGPPRAVTFSPPHPLHPPTSTSVPLYAKSIHTDTLLHPFKFAEAHGGQVGQQGNQQFQEPGTDSISPGCLEPSLITNTFESVFARYQATRADILRRRDENELMLSSFLERYGRHFSNGPIPISPINRPSFTGPEATPLTSYHTGYSPRDQADHPSWSAIRPPPYESPTQMTFIGRRNFVPLQVPRGQSGPVGAFGYDWTWDNNGFPTPHDPPQSLGNQATSGRQGRNFQQDSLQRAGPASQSQDENVPKHKKKASLRWKLLVTDLKADHRLKRAPRAKVEKSKTWYHDQIMEAKMPTSVISEEALEAGRRFGTHGVATKKAAEQKPSAPKEKPQGGRRGRKPTLDASKGFVLSNQAANKLIASGLVKESKTTGATSAAVPSLLPTTIASSAPIPAGIPVSERSLYVPNPGRHADRVAPSREVSNAAASLQALAHDYGTKTNTSAATVPTTSTAPVAKWKDPRFRWADGSTEEDSSGDDNDDPKDASFSTRSTGRKKGRSQKATNSGRKRKSVAPAAPAKRSRLNVDGGVDGAIDEPCTAPKDTPL